MKSKCNPIFGKISNAFKSFPIPKITNLSFCNLSSFDLSSVEKILGLGLKYIPQPKDLSNVEVVQAVKRFSHCILWKDFFQNQNCVDTVYDKRLVTPKTYSALPPPSMNSLKTSNILDFFKRDIYESCRVNQVKNTNQYISRTVKNLLASHPKVKFVSSDKNLGLVALDLSQYHELVMQHLSNTVHYQVQPFGQSELADFATNSRIKYETFTRSLQSGHPDIYKYLKKHTAFKIPLFHCLAKIHKTPLKGRPIVGAINWITTPVSIYLDKLLSDKVRTKEFPHIIYDTKGIIHTLSNLGPLQPNSWLVSLDIESLYTNIDIQTLSQILDKQGDAILSKLFQFITHMNFFEYNRQYYRQLKGIAMGTNAAVQLANLYLGTLFDDLAANAHKGIILYKRYIDDIFLIFNGSIEDLEEYIDSLDHLVPGIKLTRTYSQFEVNFLDIFIYKEDVDNRIQWKTFQKPINKFLYIPFQSIHPRCTFSGFISAEIARLKLTNSNPWDAAFHIEAFFEHLKARGFGRKYLEKFRKTRIPPRENPQKEPFIIPFVLRYTNTKRHDELCKIVLSYRTAFSHIFEDHKLIIAHSSSPSIGNLLLCSKLSLVQSGLISDLLTNPIPNPGPNFNRRALTDISKGNDPLETTYHLKKCRTAPP